MQKYALITGSTKGIGKQIAIDLLKRNYFVILNYSNDDSVIKLLRKELDTISSKYKIIKHDLSKIDELSEFTDKVTAITKTLDVIILNTAITNRKEFRKIEPSEWNKVINTNLTSPFFILQKLDKYINENGNIIFIGALMGTVPHAISIPYGVSKAGLHMLGKYLVKIFCDRKITVNVIAPGFVDTPWQKNKPESLRKKIEGKIALHRFATPDEISLSCMHLIDNKYINGAILNLDGGYSYE